MGFYNINFALETDQVKQINKTLNQKIIVVKSVPGADSTSTVAWLSFPAANSINVSWDETYQIYASTQEIQNGAVIDASSNTGTQTQLGKLYNYQDEYFELAGPGVPGAYNAHNKGGRNYTMGLAQACVVAGKAVFAPISADTVGNEQDISLVPRVRLSVFLSATKDNGTVISRIKSTACTFSVSTTVPTADLVFDSSSNIFLQSPDVGVVERLLLGRLRETPQLQHATA